MVTRPNALIRYYWEDMTFYIGGKFQYTGSLNGVVTQLQNDWEIQVVKRKLAEMEDHYDRILYGLPSSKYYTDAAYKWLIRAVLWEVFESKIASAVEDAQEYLKWNKETERYELPEEVKNE